MAQNKVEIEIAAQVSGQTSVDALGHGLSDLGTQGASSATKINDAWATLGVKSFAQTRVAVERVKAALDAVRASGASPVEINLATQAANAKIKELEGGVKSIGGASSDLSGMLGKLAPLMAATFGAQQFISTISSAEALSRSYEQVFGSARAAREEMDWIKVTANTLGMETLDLAKSYQSLAASTRGTTLEGQATRDVFEAVTRAMGVMGKSSAETSLALNAIAQMSSKGTVAMEELRGQLGEALPGALAAAAKGAGLTTEQLIAMVSNGNVLAKDLLPALTVGLNDLYAKAPPPQTVISEWARFKNVVTDTAIAIGEGGASNGIAQALTGLATAAKYGAAGVDILGTAIGEGAAALVTWNGTLTTSQDVAKKYGIATLEEEAAVKKATAAVQDNTSAAKENIRQQELLAQKVTQTALAIQAQYTELAKGAQDYTASIAKQTDARTAEDKVLTKLVGLYGTEAEKREVAAAASHHQATQADLLAQAQNTEALIAASYVIKLQEQAEATGDVTQATKDAIAEAQKNASSLQTAFEKTNALAQAQGIEAAASQAQVLALKDNTGRVGEYKSAVEQAKLEVERLNAAHAAGKATDAQVVNAKTNLSTATLLYRDSVKDTEAAFHSLGIKTPDELNKIAAANKIAWERVSKDMHVSTADLQTAFAAYAKSAIDANGGVATEALKVEASMHGMEIQTDRTGKTIVRVMGEGKKSTEEFATSVDSATTALEAQNKALEKTISAQEKANDLAQRAIDLENKRRNVDKEGFSLNTAGNRVVMMESDASANQRVAKRYGDDMVGNANAIAATELARKIDEARSNPMGVAPWAVQDFMAMASELTRLEGLINAAKTAGTDSRGLPLANAGYPPSTAPATTAAPAKTYTVNVNLGGTSTAINTSSDADAQALISVLKRAKLSA